MKLSRALLLILASLMVFGACKTSLEPAKTPSIVSLWKFTKARVTIDVFAHAVGLLQPVNFIILDTSMAISGDSNYMALGQNYHYTATLDSVVLQSLAQQIVTSLTTIKLAKAQANSLALPRDSGTYTWVQDTLALASKVSRAIVKFSAELTQDSLILRQPVTFSNDLTDSLLALAGIKNNLLSIDSLKLVLLLCGARSQM
jgi:hypothetical protein